MNLRAGSIHVVVFCILSSVAAVVAPDSRAITVSGDVSGAWNAGMNPVMLEGDCHIPQGASLVIGPDVRVLMAPGVSLLVDGSLFAVGLTDRPVSFLPSAPLLGPWRAIAIASDGQARMDNCILQGGGAAQPTELMGTLTVDGGRLAVRQTDISGSDSNGIYVRRGALEMDSVRIHDNGGERPTDAGVHIVTGVTTIRSSVATTTIEGSPFGIYNEDLSPVSAPNIWWGSATGPQHATNILGLGASVSDDVQYAGFITDSPNPLPGDVNQDGRSDLQDVVAAARIAAGIAPASATQVRNGDLVPDGALDLSDALALSRVILTNGP